jgi:RHS repeat-associated protein
MSDITPVLESGAKDLAESGEQAGKAVERHLGEDIGGGLDDAAKSYSDVDGIHAQKFNGLNPDQAAGDGPNPPGAGGPVGGGDPFQGDGGSGSGSGDPVAGGLSSGGLTSGGDLSVGDGGVVGDGHVDGSGGQSEDPIDLVTGEVFLPQLDLVLPGVLPLALERRHGSGYRRGRCFGPTWSSTLDQRIQVDGDGIHYAAPDGRVLHYPVPGEGRPVLPAVGPRWPLCWNRREDRITIEQTELGRNLEFPPGPTPGICRPLAAIADRSGNRIMFAYDSDGMPTDIHHSGGYRVVLGSTMTRGGLRINSVKLADPAGGPHIPVREFRYDPGGRLVESIDPSGRPLVFEYDESDRITRWVDRNGYFYAYRYRADGRVSHADGSDGYLSCRLDYDLEARTTTLTDACGQPTVYHWNNRLQTVKVIDPLGNTTLTEQDKHGNILSRTDPLGRVTQIERDHNGDPVRITRADQSTVTVGYDRFRQPVRIVGPDGGVWTYEYNDRGGLTFAIDPMGAITGYEHDDQGRLTSVTDPSGARTVLLCDKAGLHTAVTDPLGKTVRTARDCFGRIASIVDPLGATTISTWSADGRPLTRVLPDGNSETWAYDGEGNVLTHVSPSGATTQFEYGAFDVPTVRIDPDGARHRFDYDPQLRLTGVARVTGARDPAEQVLTWQYTYDDAGRLVSETDFNGAAKTYTVDASGDLASAVNATGQRVEYERDLLGRVTGRRSGESEYRFSYDGAGQLSRAEGPGSLVEYTRDPLGRVLAESVNGRALVNTFDQVGRRLSRSTPGGITSRWTYDAAGDPLQLAGTGGALAFHYDGSGRETARTLGAAAALTQTFDALGRLTGQGIWAYDQPPGPSGPEGGGPAAVRDLPAASSLAAAEAWRAIQTRTYAYRADGTPTEVTDRLRGDRRFELDAVGRVTSLTAATWSETYAYDGLGNLALAAVSPAAANSVSASASAANGEREGPREHRGTLVHRAGRTSYDYDAAGRLVRQVRRTLSGQAKIWTYTWDADNHLVKAALPDGTVWQYGYDALGRRIAKSRLDSPETGTAAETIWFTWDDQRVAEEIRTTSTGSHATTLTWDYHPNGLAPTAQTRQSWAADAAQAQIDREFHAIVTDLVGTPMELVTPDGRIAWHASTGLWGTAISAPGSTADCPLRFPGQYLDGETGLHYNLNRYYDPATASYTSPDPLGLAPSPNQHGYVDNPLSWSDPLGLAAYIHTSPVDSDWATKGAHIHVGDKEAVVSPDHTGGIKVKPWRLTNGEPSAAQLQKVADALHSDPALRADLITKARAAMEHMNSHNWGNAKNRAAEMARLIRNLEKM